ncbi:unnamed protein product, partial [Meganyctiphanes norvegica]
RVFNSYGYKTVESGFAPPQRLRLFPVTEPTTTTIPTTPAPTTTTTEAPSTTTWSSLFPSFTAASNLRKSKPGVKKLSSEGYGQKVKILRSNESKEQFRNINVSKTQSSAKSILENHRPRGGRLVSKRRKLHKRPPFTLENTSPSTTPSAPETTKTPYRLRPTMVNKHTSENKPEVVVMTRLRSFPPLIRKNPLTNAHITKPKQLYQLKPQPVSPAHNDYQFKPQPVSQAHNDANEADPNFFATTSKYFESASTTSKPRVYESELNYETVLPQPPVEQRYKLRSSPYQREQKRIQSQYEPVKPKFRPTPKKVTYQTLSPKKTTQKPTIYTESPRDNVEHYEDEEHVPRYQADYSSNNEAADYLADSPYHFDEAYYSEESEEYDD